MFSDAGKKKNGRTTEAPPEPVGSTADHESVMERDVRQLRERLVEEAASAVEMFEQALAALWERDEEGARRVRAMEKNINRDEVKIEEDAFRILALHHPVARDFREIAFIIKVNNDIERVADHANSVAKVTLRLADGNCPPWPTALRDLGERVPMHCQALLRALTAGDAEASRQILVADKTIDKLHQQLFGEIVDLMEVYPDCETFGLLLYRVGRDLERVGDLMTNIAEDIIYLETGQIVRHTKNTTPL